MKEKGKNNDTKEKLKQETKMNSADNENDFNLENLTDEETKENAENKGSLELKEKLNKLEKDGLINEYLKLYKEIEEYKNKIKIKETEANDNLDKYKRSLAELENFRKRTLLEKQDLLKYANFNILNDLLTVLDDFQRAFDSSRKDEKIDLKNFVDGIEIIEKQFIDLLFKKYGVVKFGEKGDAFDPRIHSAMIAEDGDYEEEIVIEVFRKGYLLHDRVVRAAEVKVGRPKPCLDSKQECDSNS